MNMKREVSLTGGRQLDAAVAREVCDLEGVELLSENPDTKAPRDYWYAPSGSVYGNQIKRVPPYSQSDELALELLISYPRREMLQIGRDMTGTWRVLLGGAVGDGGTLALAACRAMVLFERLALQALAKIE